MNSQHGHLVAGWLDIGSCAHAGFFGFVEFVKVPAVLIEVFEDFADCIAEFTGSGNEAELTEEPALPKTYRGLADASYSSLPAIWLLLQPSSEVSDPVVALASVGAPPKASCALAAAALAAAAHSMLRRHPEEARDRAAQWGCCLALALSSAAYTWSALSPGMAPLHIIRPDLLLLSLCNGAASFVFTLDLSFLAEQGPERAAPPLFWSLLSTAGSIAAAAAPDAGPLGRMLMLGFSWWSADFAARKAHDLAKAAVSPENCRCSHKVSDVLSISLALHPLVQGLALCCPDIGLMAFAGLDAFFQIATAHTILRSRWAVSRAIDVKLARCRQTIDWVTLVPAERPRLHDVDGHAGCGD